MDTTDLFLDVAIATRIVMVISRIYQFIRRVWADSRKAIKRH